jgi:hypothetical protein
MWITGTRTATLKWNGDPLNLLLLIQGKQPSARIADSYANDFSEVEQPLLRLLELDWVPEIETSDGRVN